MKTWTPEQLNDRKASVLEARNIVLNACRTAGIVGYHLLAGAFWYLGEQFDEAWTINVGKEGELK